MDLFVKSGNNKATYGHMNPRQKSLTNSLVIDVIVGCGLPIAIVDNPSFQKFLFEMDPKYQPPCRQTITHSILPQIREDKQEQLQAFLDTCTDVALTTDIWTDRRAHAFLGITVHAFRKGSLASHLLAFRAFHGSHTGQSIADALEAVISESKIQTKVRYVVTDNASNMKKAMSVLFDDGSDEDLRIDDDDDPSLWEDVVSDELSGSLNNISNKRIPCFAHSLQLVIRDALGSLGLIRPALAKCSKLANLLHQSALFRSAFESAMGPGRTVPSTNETRWNSTFRQLKVIVSLEQVKLAGVLRDSSQSNLILTAKEISQLQELVDILGPFAEATDLTQGDKMVTISCIIPVILSLTKKLQSTNGPATTFTGLIKNLLQGLHDRFRGIYASLGIETPGCHGGGRDLSFDGDVFLMATSLDPTYAYHWLDDLPASFEEKQGIRRKIEGNVMSLEYFKICPSCFSIPD